ncbi:MAG: hypothetical protein KAT48_02185 [Bacteroidales bacterium]|nr:hypothetical protein [Bacteroidales bacterium]
MKNLAVTSLLILAVTFLFSGCLTVEKKEYIFELTGENSGRLTIKYYNILSMKDDTTDVSGEDFQELLSDYVYGSVIEEDYPNATNIQKEFYEENGVLCAKITLDFNDLAAVRLFRYKEDSPFMLNLGNLLQSESYNNSNGYYGGEIMPVVFWESTLSKLSLITVITPPDESTVSLLDNFLKWKEEQH